MPPPCPELLHWFTVAGVDAVTPVMLLTMATLHVTVPPPPLPDPSHWVTEVTSWVEVVVVVTQGRGALAAPWHSVTVRVELVTPVAMSRLLVTVTAQATAWPPALSVPLHWLTAGAVARGRTIAGVADLIAGVMVELTGGTPESGREDVGTAARAAAVGPTAHAWL